MYGCDGAEARASSWHTDVTFVNAYPQISILRALVVPEYGGSRIPISIPGSIWPSCLSVADSMCVIGLYGDYRAG